MLHCEGYAKPLDRSGSRTGNLDSEWLVKFASAYPSGPEVWVIKPPASVRPWRSNCCRSCRLKSRSGKRKPLKTMPRGLPRCRAAEWSVGLYRTCDLPPRHSSLRRDGRVAAVTQISPALGIGEFYRRSHLLGNGSRDLPRTRPARRLPGAQLKSGLDRPTISRAGCRKSAWRGHP